MKPLEGGLKNVGIVKNGKFEVHETYFYGCYDHPRQKSTVWVQDGWKKDGTRKMVSILNPMSKQCMYSKTTIDPACTGCRWRVIAGAPDDKV